MRIKFPQNILFNILFIVSGAFLLLQLLSCGGTEQTASSVRRTITFSELDSLFQNPSKGWMSFQTIPTHEPRFSCSVGDFRFNWADLEPEDGKYNWSPIDEAIAAWKKRGARSSFRIMTTNAHTSGYYCSPKWLFDKGCKSFEYVRGGDNSPSGGKKLSRIEPDYSDQIFLDKHATFIFELGKRYDGDPDIEFIDIGSYGIWGEWHTPNYVNKTIRQRIIDMYLAAFKKTPLVMMTAENELLEYAINHGAGLRRDGIGSPDDARSWIDSTKSKPVVLNAWEKSPVVFEWYGSYDFMQEKKWSLEQAVQFMYDQHVTFINDNIGAVPQEKLQQLQKLGRLSGYQFVLREVSYPEKIKRGNEFLFTMKWANIGVAPLYRHYPLEIYILDSRNSAVYEVTSQADARNWLPGEYSIEENIRIPETLIAGEYTIALAFVDPQNNVPAIKLGIDAKEKDRRYEIGKVVVE